MTNFTTRMMIAAATVVVAAGVASAQTMKAEIPFTFRAGDKMMPAGTYHVANVNHQTSTPMFHIANSASRAAVVLVPRSAADPKSAWTKDGAPMLAFECSGSDCALTAVWTGAHTPAYNISHPKLGNEGPMRVATISMRPATTN